VIHTVLIVLGGWCALSVLTYLLVLPLLRSSGRTDELRERAVTRAVANTAGSNPRSSGYSGLVLERLALHACTVLGAEETCILSTDSASADTLVPIAGHGVDAEEIGRRLPLERAPAALAVRSGQPVLVPYGARGTQTAAAAPVVVAATVRGAISVRPSEGSAIGLRELASLDNIAGLVGRAFEHAGHRELSRSDPGGEIDSLVSQLCEADRRPGGHYEAIAGLARAVGRRLDLEEPDLTELELAARLYDVGKVRLPLHILRKPGPLAPDEWEVMKLHAVWGEEMVGALPGLGAVALIVRFHHERVDGRGYPDGLSADRIPLASRIVSACDAYASMTTERPYRPARDPVEAVEQLAAGAGNRFDPQVVDAMAEVFGVVPAGAVATAVA
jgi:HD-GYP domain-containing protein (c-di-GMP phosphodiesterase class II)